MFWTFWKWSLIKKNYTAKAFGGPHKSGKFTALTGCWKMPHNCPAFEEFFSILTSGLFSSPFLSDSLRPSSPAPPSSPASASKVIPIPTAGRSSRPSSARSVSSTRNAENISKFTVKDFNHFCWDEEVISVSVSLDGKTVAFFSKPRWRTLELRKTWILARREALKAPFLSLSSLAPVSPQSHYAYSHSLQESCWFVRINN